MVEASGVTARVRFSLTPLIEGTWDLVQQGIAPGGTHRNLHSVNPVVAWGSQISNEAKLVLCDAQTSGGLLMSVPAGKVDDLMAAMSRRGVSGVVVIGEVVERRESEIEVLW